MLLISSMMNTGYQRVPKIRVQNRRKALIYEDFSGMNMEFDSLIPCYDRKLESLVKSRFFSFFVLSENINTKLDGRNRVCYIDFIKITVHNERKTGER